MNEGEGERENFFIHKIFNIIKMGKSEKIKHLSTFSKHAKIKLFKFK